ncbi:hypothetical protein C818_04262 [Lachnospiraceae bacterium MD308]|nr:hypothetical protein C818_04262 [Lachnospiraceae bacterium MD308]
MWFTGTGNSKDYGAFGCVITSLKEKVWFMDYVTRWVWYRFEREFFRNKPEWRVWKDKRFSDET